MKKRLSILTLTVINSMIGLKLSCHLIRNMQALKNSSGTTPPPSKKKMPPELKKSFLKRSGRKEPSDKKNTLKESVLEMSNGLQEKLKKKKKD